MARCITTTKRPPTIDHQRPRSAPSPWRGIETNANAHSLHYTGSIDLAQQSWVTKGEKNRDYLSTNDSCTFAVFAWQGGYVAWLRGR